MEQLRPIIIGEVKTRTPHDPQWRPEESLEERFEIAEAYADWIAIHTNRLWGGSFQLLEKVRELTEKPILAKGFHDTDEELKKAFDRGADHVLRVGNRMPPEEYANNCLLEPYTLYDLRQITVRGIRWAVWNSRNPSTGENKIDDFEIARAVRDDGLLCQASNIRTWEDVHPAADAVLVGTHLPEFVQTIPRQT